MTPRISERRCRRVSASAYTPSSLLVINATERPLFSTRVCSRSTSPPGIDLRPRGRGLESVTRKREREREREREETGAAKRGRGVVHRLPSSWSRPSRGTALNPIKFLTDRRFTSTAFPRIDRMVGSIRKKNVKGNNR